MKHAYALVSIGGCSTDFHSVAIAGSIPVQRTNRTNRKKFFPRELSMAMWGRLDADDAEQVLSIPSNSMAECFVANEEVASSNLV